MTHPQLGRSAEASKSSLFAIAYATELAGAGDPASWIYDNSLMREHHCLESKKLFTKFGKEDHSSWDKTEDVNDY